MFRSVMLIIASAVLVAGCAPGGALGGMMNASADKPTITKAQALDRIKQLIDGTVSVIHPKPQLELHQPSLNDGLCLDPVDGGSEDRIVVNRSYFLRELPKDKLDEVATQVKAYWQSQDTTSRLSRTTAWRSTHAPARTTSLSPLAGRRATCSPWAPPPPACGPTASPSPRPRPELSRPFPSGHG